MLAVLHGEAEAAVDDRRGKGRTSERMTISSTATDEAIAQDLADRGRLDPGKYHVWFCKQRHDRTSGFELQRLYMRSARRLQEWAKEIQDIVNLRREEIRSGRLLTGVTVASGSKTRRAGDPTACGRLPSEESSWDADRLRVNGVLDRWSRKGYVPVVPISRTRRRAHIDGAGKN